MDIGGLKPNDCFGIGRANYEIKHSNVYSWRDQSTTFGYILQYNYAICLYTFLFVYACAFVLFVSQIVFDCLGRIVCSYFCLAVQSSTIGSQVADC